MDNRIQEAVSDIDILLKKRFDLIPNLVDSIKGYTKHENGTLTDITKLRKVFQNSDMDTVDAMKLDNKINNVLAIAEAYSELKASDQFIALQDNLNKLEDKLIDARTRYNRYVTIYNNKIETVPSDIVDKLFFFDKN